MRTRSQLSSGVRHRPVVSIGQTRPGGALRRQLSLYVPAAMATALTRVRRIVDPVQSHLIPPHVTLCRDDDLAGLAPSDIGSRLAPPGVGPLTFVFGQAESFGGHGILLPCVGGQAEFHALRARILGVSPDEQTPHLTLAHPRNPKAGGNNIAQARALATPFAVTFTLVHWIEQEGGAPWHVRHSYRIGEDT